MKKILKISLILLATTMTWGCSDNTSSSDPDFQQAPAERQFVWEAMNYWYYWQEDVPELADNMAYFDSNQDYHNFLNSFSSIENLFYELVFDDPGLGEDDFSFFIQDYEEFHEAQQGVSYDFGFEFGLVRFCQECTEVFGYVQYVLPGSPAESAGLERGDIFTAVNGTALTIANYQSALAGDSYNLTMAEVQNQTFSETGETVSVEAVSLQEDPIFISRVIETGSSKVGYLMYNAFQRNSHENLNQVFGDFIADGINELVVDLRYNGGGALITSALLASMISGLGETEDFAEYTFNTKRSDENSTLPFLDEIPVYDSEGNTLSWEGPINKLSLDRVYFLVDYGTASASETLINGLIPYMDVLLVGIQTVGKDEGSLTLYDSGPEYTERSNANPEHKYAIQPIVLKIVNANGEDYPEGFIPDHTVSERDYLGNLPPLGDESDPLLAKALELITGGPVAKLSVESAEFRGKIFKDSRDLQKFGKGMYVLPEQIMD